LELFPDYIFIDLKPENVMIMPDSPNPKEIYDDGNFGRLRIKLTDFGSALKFVPENGKRKLSNKEKKHLMGTAFYWAPELFDETIDEVYILIV
jgi:serine/threonine protein kinase